MFEDSKQLLGLGGRYRRYIRQEDLSDLTDISDPTSLEDETRTTWREWAGQNKALVIAGSLFGAVGLALLVWQASRILPAIIHNTYVQAGAAAAALVGFGMYLGWNRRRSVAEKQDTLDLIQEDGNIPFYGIHLTQRNGANLFVPMKGMSRSAQSLRPYRLDELGALLDQQFSKRGVPGDAPVRIMLHPQYESYEDTDLGTSVTVRSGDLEPVPEGESAVLRTTIPEYDDEEMDEMATDLEDQAKAARRWRERYYDLKRQYDQFREHIDEPVEERVEKHLEHTKELAIVTRGGGRSHTNGHGGQSVTAGDFDVGEFDFVGTGDTGPAVPGPSDEEILEEVEEEVTPEDDDDE